MFLIEKKKTLKKEVIERREENFEKKKSEKYRKEIDIRNNRNNAKEKDGEAQAPK